MLTSCHVERSRNISYCSFAMDNNSERFLDFARNDRSVLDSLQRYSFGSTLTSSPLAG